MTFQTMNCALVIAVVGATAFGAVMPAWSAPVMTSAATIAATLPMPVKRRPILSRRWLSGLSQ